MFMCVCVFPLFRSLLTYSIGIFTILSPFFLISILLVIFWQFTVCFFTISHSLVCLLLRSLVLRWLIQEKKTVEIVILLLLAQITKLIFLCLSFFIRVCVCMCICVLYVQQFPLKQKKNHRRFELKLCAVYYKRWWKT